MIQRYPSVLLENAVNELSSLPGIGRKTALRLALHLLKRDIPYVENFSKALIVLRKDVKYCRLCHNISDHDLCQICAGRHRNHSIICVVESIREVMAIENTGQFNGVYHVLGGRISPIEGIGPADLEIDSLVERVKGGELQEVILALSTTMDGDMTNFFINRKLSDLDVQVSVIARGVSIGDELEYADEVTLGRSILNRIRFSESVKM
ncbi:MAG: recombination mediator RecR [Tannerella sp.]|jgi:recombination protein RecR|nr:recombination mediator RecR [Tannerella sp.]